MHQRIGVERTLHPACVRAKDLVGYLARPEALCLLGMFQSHCAMRNQMKKVLKNILFHFSWKEYHQYHPTSWIQQWIQQCIYMQIPTRKPSADNAFEAADEARGILFLKMQGTEEQIDRSSEFIQGHQKKSFGASTQIWIFGASISARFNSTRCSKSFGFFSMLRKKISRPWFASKIGILAFTGRKGTGFYPFPWTTHVGNMQIKDVNGKYVFFAGKSFLSFLPKNSHLSFLIVLLNQLDW